MATGARSDLEVRVRGRDELSPVLSNLDSKIIRWVGAISASLAAIQIGAAPVVQAAQFERELANVRKTTNFATADMRKLSDEILRMSTRLDVSAIDLAKIAAGAGQQGLGRYGVDGVIEFTKSISRMASVLDITADEAAENVGKIVNIFKIPLSEIEKVSSTINEISNNTTASGKDLLDVIKRIGDAAGQLSFDQAAAFAATGLDFGASPEVVGTSFAKMFSSLRERATDFAKLLKMSTDDWFKSLDENSYTAFRTVLQRMRELKPQDQQAAIVKLFGGGRIGSLVNKLVQDTQDTVLRRAMDTATEGSKGLSAIKEQETVLNTLSAQSRAALNSLIKLGIDLAEQSLKPLAQYMAQFNAQLQEPGTKASLQAIANAVGGVATWLIDAAKYVASLNINWENFIRVVKAFLALKVAEYFGGALFKSFSQTSDRLNYIINGTQRLAETSKKAGDAATAAAAVSAAADERSRKGMLWRILGVEDYIKSLKTASVEQKKLADEEKAQAAARSTKAGALVAQRGAASADKAATGERDTAVSAAQAQRARLAKVEDDVVKEQQRLWNVMQGKMTERENKSNADRLKIEQDFQTKKKALQASGSMAGLTALKRERDALLVAEEASYNRSLVATQAYYTKKAQIAALGAKAGVDAERAALMASLSNMDGKINQQAATAASLGAAKAATAQASAGLDAVNQRMTLMARVAGLAAAATGGLMGALRALGTAAVAVGRLLSGAFFWVTILYSIGDMFGVFDKLGGWLQTVTDKMGFTSAAARRQAVAHKEAEEAARKQKEELKQLIAESEKYMEIGNPGVVKNVQIDAIMTKIREAEDPSTQSMALAELDNLLKAIEGRKQQAMEDVGDAAGEVMRKAQAEVADLSKKLAEAVRLDGTTTTTFGPGGFPMQGVVDNTEQIEQLSKALKEAEGRMRTIGDAAGVGERALKGLDESSRRVSVAIAGMFTAETLQFAQSNFAQYTELGKAFNEAVKEYEELSAAQKRGDASEEQVKEAQKNMSILKERIGDVKANLIDLINEQIKRAKDLKLPEEVINSWNQLLVLMNIAPKQTEEVIAAAANAAKVVGQGVLTGTNATKPKAPTTGDRDFKVGDRGGESKARKEARARLELERAELKARADLRAETDKQILDAEQNAYDLGLRNIASYWAMRNTIEQRGIDDDIADRREELKAVEDELKNSKEKAEQLRFQAQIVRIKGQIDVLEASRAGVEARARRDQEAATQAFNDRVRSEMNSLIDQGIINADTLDAFQGNLDEMAAGYRTFIEQLKSQGRGQLANSLMEGLSLDALRRTMAPLQNDMDLAMSNISRSFQRLQLAQESGAITSNQYFLQYDRGVQMNIRGLEAFIAQQERLMNSFTGDRGSLAYRQMAAGIDEARLKLQQFAAEQDKVAKDFNQKTTDSLTDALSNMEFSVKSLREQFLGFLQSIAKNVQSMMGKALSESIMQSLGQTGSGGLGGFFQNIVQGPKSLAATGLQRGNTMVTPLFVQEVNRFPGTGSGTGGDGGFLGEFADMFKPDKEDPLAKKPSGLLTDEGAQSFLGGLGDTIGSNVSKVTDGLGGMFGGLISTLSTLFTSLIAAMGANSTASAVGGVVAAAAHTGGVAGRTRTSRRVNPAVFANAARMHGGGKVSGLRPNEVPMILEEGETVRTQQQEAMLQRSLKESGVGQMGEVAIRNVLVTDPNMIPDGMASARGERTLMTMLQKNKSTLKQMVRS